MLTGLIPIPCPIAFKNFRLSAEWLDEYHTLAQCGPILTGLKLQNGFGRNLPNSFSEMKSSYGCIFHQLTQCTPSAKGVGLLLSLAQMMLHFMTVYFPSLLLASVQITFDSPLPLANS